MATERRIIELETKMAMLESLVESEKQDKDRKMKEKDDSIIKANQKITALETQLKSKEEEIREM